MQAERAVTAVEAYESVVYTSSAHTGNLRLGTVEREASGANGRFAPEAVRGERILQELLTREFQTVLDIGAGALEHSSILIDAGKTVDTCDFGTSDYACVRRASNH